MVMAHSSLLAAFSTTSTSRGRGIYGDRCCPRAV